VEGTLDTIRVIVEKLRDVRRVLVWINQGGRTQRESAVASQTYSVSNRVGMARTLGIKRTVDEPNNSERPPIFSSQMVISGFLPCQITSTIVLPEASVIVVRRRSGESLGFEDCESGVSRFAQWTEDDEEEGSEPERTTDPVAEKGAEPEREGVLGSSARSSVVISKARSPVATSMREELSMSGEVNLSNMVDSGMILDIFSRQPWVSYVLREEVDGIARNGRGLMIS